MKSRCPACVNYLACLDERVIMSDIIDCSFFKALSSEV